MYGGWRPYVSAAKKRAKASRHAKKLEKQGRKLQPVQIEGRIIAKTFWGKAWCDNLERYSDYANRLPRGRTYARNGSIIDLQLHKGKITAIVQGSSIYDVTIELTPLASMDWKKITRDCSQSIHSLLDLLQGRLSDGVMERLVRPKEGLFPQPKEIGIHCSCPDWAGLCKHAAAVLYGVGARLDKQPELLFLLRQVDQAELISRAVDGANLKTALDTGKNQALQDEDLGELFGIELDVPSSSQSTRSTRKSKKKSTKPQKKSTTTKSTKATKATRTKKTQTKKKAAAAGKATPKQANVKSVKKTKKTKTAVAVAAKPVRSPKKTASKPASKGNFKSGTSARRKTKKSKTK